MTRKQAAIGGVILVVLIILGVLASRGRFDRSGSNGSLGTNAPIVELNYCNEDQVRPCVVSFSIDADGNMLVNLLLPDLGFPDFYLKIAQSGGDITYDCLRVKDTPNSAYCTGEKLPPGDAIHIMLFSSNADVLLADGTLSIIGLAFPTLGVVTTTLENTQTLSPTAPPSTASPTQTAAPQKATPTPTRPPPSYPNPTRSYP